MSDAWVFVALGFAAFVLGLRGSVRLTRRYRAVHDLLEARERDILRSFALVSWVITVTAGYFDIVSVRRILGFEAFTWTPFVSVILASAVLFIPAFLDYIVSRVARVPWK